MPKTERRTWFVAPVVWMLILTLASLKGILPLSAALILLPVVAAVLAYTSGTLAALVLCAVALGCSAVTLPSGAWPVALPWCALSGAIAVIPFRKPVIRPVLWAAFTASAWVGGLLILSGIWQGRIADGLAQSCCDWISASPVCDSLLLNAYSAGLSRLSGVTVNIAGGFLMTDEIRMELLYSLRVSLEHMLPGFLCDAFVYHTALTAFLCVLLPDSRRRRNGEKGILPSVDQWYIPRGLGLAVTLLALGWLVAYLSDGGVTMYLGWMCAAVFKAAYLLQGVCLLQWLEKKIGVRSTARNVWAILLSVLAPVVPIVMGMIDQRRDARHLRPNEEAD